VIPVGGSLPLGACAFTLAMLELLEQVPAPDVIVHATSSCGTTTRASRQRPHVDADQARRFGTHRWSTTISAKSVARGLKSSRVLIARLRGRLVGSAKMETKKSWALDLK
jgi:hypothetical protein